MGNFIAVHVLRQYNPGTFNRGEDGDAKQIYIGGTNRVRFSSQCQKRVIREAMACPEIRTSRIEELVNECLNKYVEDGTITEAEKDIIGNGICSKAVIGANCWAFLKGGDTKDKRVVTTTNADELTAIVTSMIKYFKEVGEDGFKLKDGRNAKLTEYARKVSMQYVRTSISKAMFGAMATDGAIGSVDGAVEMGQAFSVDEYHPTSDFFSVKHSGKSGATETDPFYQIYNDFSSRESRKTAAETINMGLDLYSNLMYSYSNVNIKELVRNLNTYVATNEYEEHEDTADIVKTVVPQFVREMILMTPEATQNRSSSHVEPSAVLIEIIKDGANIQPDWSQVVEGDRITEQAITRLAKFANNTTFRTGELKQFVLFSENFEDMADQFKNATKITNLKELEEVLKNEADELME